MILARARVYADASSPQMPDIAMTDQHGRRMLIISYNAMAKKARRANRRESCGLARANPARGLPRASAGIVVLRARRMPDMLILGGKLARLVCANGQPQKP